MQLLIFLTDITKVKAKWEEEMKARMLQNDKEILEMKKSYEDKLKAQKKDVGVWNIAIIIFQFY